MQFALREPYANGFLNRLDGAPKLLEICGLPCAPSESAYSKFKKKLVEIPYFMDYIVQDHCGRLPGMRGGDRTVAGSRHRPSRQSPRWANRW